MAHPFVYKPGKTRQNRDTGLSPETPSSVFFFFSFPSPFLVPLFSLFSHFFSLSSPSFLPVFSLLLRPFSFPSPPLLPTNLMALTTTGHLSYNISPVLSSTNGEDLRKPGYKPIHRNRMQEHSIAELTHRQPYPKAFDCLT